MSDEQEIQACVMCQKFNDQMLMLGCIHDPCISCAAINYHETSQTSESQKVYTCAICREVTELDSTSVIELQRVYSLISSQSKKYDYKKGAGGITGPAKGFSSNKKSEQFPSILDRVDRIHPEKQIFARNERDSYLRNQYAQPYTHPVSQPSYAPSTNPKKPLSLICPDHSDEEISYYCFTCQKPICPQCAIHGSHREHEVQTTRKAIKAIKQTVQTWNTKITEQLNIQNLKREDWRRCMKDMTEGVKRERQIIQDQFNKLRSVILEKQKEFQKVVDSNYEQNSLQIKKSMAQVDKNIDTLSNQRKGLDFLIKKDDISVLQEYSSRQEETRATLQSSSIKKQQQDSRKQADFQLMQQQIEQLMGILSAMRLSTSKV